MVTAPIRMSPTGFKAFVEVLSQPACPVPEMVELFQRTGPWEPREANAESEPWLFPSRCHLHPLTTSSSFSRGGPSRGQAPPHPANQVLTAIVRRRADRASHTGPVPKDRRAARTRRSPC
jgi:hypothetical protein